MFDKVSRAKDYACIEVEGSRDLSKRLTENEQLRFSRPIRLGTILSFWRNNHNDITQRLKILLRQQSSLIITPE